MYAYLVQSTFCKSSSLSTTLFMCLVLSEVRSVRPVWVSGTALSASPQRGEPATPRERHAAESTDRSSEAHSTGSVHPRGLRDISSALEHAAGAGAFLFLCCLLSFPRGRASSGDCPEAQSRGSALRYYYHVLRVCLSMATCPIPSATHEPSGRDSPYLLTLCAQSFSDCPGRIPHWF